MYLPITQPSRGLQIWAQESNCLDSNPDPNADRLCDWPEECCPKLQSFSFHPYKMSLFLVPLWPHKAVGRTGGHKACKVFENSAWYTVGINTCCLLLAKKCLANTYCVLALGRWPFLSAYWKRDKKMDEMAITQPQARGDKPGDHPSQSGVEDDTQRRLSRENDLYRNSCKHFTRWGKMGTERGRKLQRTRHLLVIL